MTEMKYSAAEESSNPLKMMEEKDNQTEAASKDSSMTASRDSSVFSFHNVSLTSRNLSLIKPKNKDSNKKFILKGVSGSVHSGHVLAIMGPSGAGKTSFIRALTLEAFSLRSTGLVTLNGVPVTSDMLKQQFFVVKQFDKHWPHLTCREALTYAAHLYNVAVTTEERDAAVVEMLKKMGMVKCSNTKCMKLSGGEQRRLSIAIALLKQARVIFLDEPTSGLDGAAACKVMQEICQIAKDEGLIIICTIHQPSSKIFKLFDQIMILSKGQQAFCGNAVDLVSYFRGIGYSCPSETNPAEFVMDLVNADFSCDEEVNKILDAWKMHKKALESSGSDCSSDDEDDIERNGGATSKPKRHNRKIGRNSLLSEIPIILNRQAKLIGRDPMLYLGRFVMFFIANSLLAYIFWGAWANDQAKALQKVWSVAMYLGGTGCMGVVSVYANNLEFKSVQAESKNGMVNVFSYIMAKTILVIPIIFMFAISSLAIPGFAIQQWPISRFGVITTIFALTYYCYECVAECLSVWFDNPILGMIFYLLYWLLTFVFGGVFIPDAEIVWPLRFLYLTMPFQYYLRPMVYEVFMYTLWCPCTDIFTSAVCANSFDSADVLNSLGRIFPIFSPEDTTSRDMLILFTIAIGFKILHIIGVVYKGRKASRFISDE